MREKKLVMVCVLALVIVFASIQCLPEASQYEELRAPPLREFSAFVGIQSDINPCGGGGGDDGGGSAPR